MTDVAYGFEEGRSALSQKSYHRPRTNENMAEFHYFGHQFVVGQMDASNLAMLPASETNVFDK